RELRFSPDRASFCSRGPATSVRFWDFRTRACPCCSLSRRKGRDLRVGNRPKSRTWRRCYGAGTIIEGGHSGTTRGRNGLNRSAKEIGAMAARAIWRGQIRLALVSIPVELFPATKSGAQIQFHQVHEPTGKRIKYEKVVPGIGPVDRDEIVKGYEVSKGHYVLLDPEEIESVKLESRKTLDLVEFVDTHDIDAMYYDKPYFVVPADDLAEEAYVVMRDALKASKKYGVGQLAMRGQEYVVALKPCGKGLLLETLRYADEVHKAQSFFREIGDEKPDADLLDMASMLIERKTGKFDPA